MNRVLILGVSGFIGGSIYKELRPYFDVYGTYRTENIEHATNQIFFEYDVQVSNISGILESIRPNYIISSLRGDFKSQLKAHENILRYASKRQNCKLIFLSSVNVFDGNFGFPSYEDDHPKTESRYGHYKLSVENLIKKSLSGNYVIARLPLVLGVNSPRIVQLKQAIKHRADFEVYPNLIISVTTADKIAQQIHYIINKDLTGIYHLSSSDMTHHKDLFEEIASKLGDKMPIFKNVYRSNDDNYLAILPKINKLPINYRITVNEVIEASTLKDEIVTLKN